MDEVQVDDQVFATFEKYDEFCVTQSRFLELCTSPPSSDVQSEADECLKKLDFIVRLYLCSSPNVY